MVGSGFADADGKFFRALAKHNDRKWFQEHKKEFEDGWNAPMKRVLHDVRSSIDRAYAHCDLEEPRVFRIFRDVRFSKDKSPYKTHVGGFIAVKTAKQKTTDASMALYFHVGHDRIFGAAGHYRMEPPALAAFRRAVADETTGKELVRILAKLRKKGFEPRAHEETKKIPKGFDAAHPRADLLKWKGLIVMFPPLPKGLLVSPKLVPWLVTQCKAAAPLVEWLVYATA